jgi:hypothetical protein
MNDKNYYNIVQGESFDGDWVWDVLLDGGRIKVILDQGLLCDH